MQPKITNILLLVANAVLILGVKTLAGPCPLKDPSKIMSCHYAGEAVFYLGLLGCILALLKMFFRRYAKLMDTLALISALAAGSCMGFTIKLCTSTRMHCQLFMKPFVIVLVLFIIVVAVWDYYLQKSAKPNNK